jgi:hypothetical protein
MEDESDQCPYCRSNQGCEHLLLCLDTTFRQAEGGYLWEHFNDAWSKIFCANSEDVNFDEREAFDKLLEQVNDLADDSSEWVFESGRPGSSSAYLAFWISSDSKAKDLIEDFIKMNA